MSYLQKTPSQMAAHLGQRAWSTPLLLAEERHRLRCIHEPIGAQAERDPEGIAAVCEGQSPRLN